MNATQPTSVRLPLRAHIAVLAFYLLLAVMFTFPLILHFDTHVLAVRDDSAPLGGAKIDNMEYVWKLWWVPHALFDLHISPFFAPDIYAPFGYPLAYGEITPLHTFGLLPITLLFGATAAFNVAALGSTMLTGWATYLLARRFLTQNTGQHRGGDEWLIHAAALFAGAAFALCGYRMQRLMGHLPLLGTHFLALALFQLDVWLERRRPHHAALLGAWIGLAGLSSWYYVFILGLTLPCYALFMGALQHWRERRLWAGGAIIGIAAAAIMLPFLLPYLQLNTQGATRVPAQDAAFWAASPIDYLIPNPLHPLWGDAVQGLVWPLPGALPTEFIVQIGWLTLALGLIAWHRARGARWRGLKAFALLAFLLSLGPELHLSRLPLGIPMPAALLRLFVPFADSLRSWGRFSVLVMLVFSLLAASGIVWVLRERARRTQVVGAAALLAALLFGSWIGAFPLAEVAPRPVDTWLVSQPDRSPIMEYPLSVALTGPAMLSTRYHQHPVTFGYGTYLPLLYRQRHPALLTFPADPALDLLASWGVRHILVTTAALTSEPYTLADIDTQPRLTRVIELGGVIVYELVE